MIIVVSVVDGGYQRGNRIRSPRGVNDSRIHALFCPVAPGAHSMMAVSHP